ncbi:MAG: hypothetical protein M3220_18505 [Chloroflexota bacterium]|nr:hypothetical protein [Chloroflexota bacterium]
MEIVLTIHSLIRWLILFVAIIALVKFGAGWLRTDPFTPTDRGLMSTFTGMIDLQLLLGLILLFVGGEFTRYQLEHTVTMLVAVGVAHLPLRWRDAPDPTRFRNNLVVIIVVLLLIVAGISVLPGNRWTL